MPFVIGWIISMIANPLVKFLEQRVKILRKHSSAIIIVAVIAVVVGVLYGMFAILFTQIKSFSNDIPEIYKEMEHQISHLSIKLHGIYDILPAGARNFFDQFVISIKSSSSDLLSRDNMPSISTASTFAKNVVEMFLMSIITILSAYFFIKEGDNIVNKLKSVMPESAIYNYNLIISNFKIAVGGYFKAQFKIMIILIIILFIGLEILHVHYSFLLAAVIAFLDFLPFLGTGAVIWPWAVADFFLGNYFQAVVLLIIYIICQVVKQVLQPKMVGDSIGISPLSTLIFMFIGYRFMGVFGLIIGIPIGMVLISFYRLGMFNRIIKGFQIIFHDINQFRKF
jgi:sporulation integral membrane protein YtvI